MAISFDQLRFVDPTPEARRLLWHVLSIGSVTRDEPERHEGLDKAGLFLFQVVNGSGRMELNGRNYLLKRGNTCWLVDLRQSRNYVPTGRAALRTQSVRFSGPAVESWLDLLGLDPVFELPPGLLRRRLTRLLRLVLNRPARHEWEIHCELTALLGDLLAARRLFNAPHSQTPAPVSHII
jgi:hypothetical protein